MEPNTESKPEIIAEFNRRRIRQVIAVIPVVSIMFPALTTADSDSPNQILLWIFYVVGILFIAFTIKNWRCPSCNGWLGRGIGPNFCRKCGVRLQAEMSSQE